LLLSKKFDFLSNTKKYDEQMINSNLIRYGAGYVHNYFFSNYREIAFTFF
jgi:hypothetical protein